MDGSGMTDGLADVAWIERTWISLAAPELIPPRLTDCRPAVLKTLRLPGASRVGASFTGDNRDQKGVARGIAVSVRDTQRHHAEARLIGERRYGKGAVRSGAPKVKAA